MPPPDALTREFFAATRARFVLRRESVALNGSTEDFVTKLRRELRLSPDQLVEEPRREGGVGAKDVVTLLVTGVDAPVAAAVIARAIGLMGPGENPMPKALISAGPDGVLEARFKAPGD